MQQLPEYFSDIVNLINIRTYCQNMLQSTNISRSTAKEIGDLLPALENQIHFYLFSDDFKSFIGLEDWKKSIQNKNATIKSSIKNKDEIIK